MNKKFMFSSMSAVVVAIAIFIIFDNLKTKEVEVHSNIAYTVEYNEIADFADLIVLATRLSDLNERKNDITYYGDSKTDIQQFRSFTEVKIDRILKDTSANQSQQSTLTVVEPIVFLEKENTLLKQENYDELEKKQTYILFLKKSPNGDYYSILRDNDGMEKIDTESKVDIDKQIEQILQKHNVSL